MSRHRRGTLIIRPLTVREVDTTGLEPQITLLRSGLLGIDDVAALEESGALRRLVDAGVFDDQRILNLFYRLITPPAQPGGRGGQGASAAPARPSTALGGRGTRRKRTGSGANNTGGNAWKGRNCAITIGNGTRLGSTVQTYTVTNHKKNRSNHERRPAHR